jgi:hypothetical protein
VEYGTCDKQLFKDGTPTSQKVVVTDNSALLGVNERGNAMGMTLKDYEAMYPARLDSMLEKMEEDGKKFFTASQMQRLHHIGYNHARHIIDYGVSAGKIADPKDLGRYQYA